MTSCLLFHGPGAKLAACEEASKIGYLLVPPIGDDEKGLRVEEVREGVMLLQSSPLGNRKGVVVLGPLDGGSSLKASDALLKTIEERSNAFVVPILWAHDLGGVPWTIRSRCLEQWAGTLSIQEEGGDLISLAWSAVDAAIREDYPNLVGIIRGQLGKEHKARALVEALAECLSQKLDNPTCLRLWGQIRPLTKAKDIVGLDVLAALLLEGDSE